METQASNFEKFGLSSYLLQALNDLGFTTPTEIQEKTIPVLLQKQQDLIALASTGSGKTGAFGIPLVEKIDATSKATQGLILCPTRELAIQVSDQIQKISKYNKLTIATVYGGSSYRPQEQALRKGAQIIVATPGRLIDFLDQGLAKLGDLKALVLDEADEMISMGFQEPLENILKAANPDSQKWLFSATMSREIRQIADKYLTTPHIIKINTQGGISQTIEQVYFTVKNNHKDEAIERILQTHRSFYGIIFCQTKAEVIGLAERLKRQGFSAESIHGDRSQMERESVLRRFRSKDVTILVATDVAARGLDIKNLTHVVNHSLPWDVESYIHRIGRTARNGEQGAAYSLVNPEQVRKLARIQTATGKTLTKGTIPSATTVAYDKIEQFLTSTFSANFENPAQKERLDNVSGIIKDLFKHKEPLKEQHSVHDLLARMVLQKYPDLFSKSDLELDFMAGRPPRELTPDSMQRRNSASQGGYSSGGRSAEGRSEGRSSGGRSFGRGARSEGRSAEGRSSEGRSTGGRYESREETRSTEARPPRRDEPRKERYSSSDEKPVRRFASDSSRSEGRSTESRSSEGRGETRTEGRPGRREERPYATGVKRHPSRTKKRPSTHSSI